MTQDPGPFAGRMTRSPAAFDAERGREAAEGYGDLPSQLRDVVAGAGGSSPYLKALIEREREWAAPMLTGTPEHARETILAEVDGLDESALKPGLRQAKRRIALLTA